MKTAFGGTPTPSLERTVVFVAAHVVNLPTSSSVTCTVLFSRESLKVLLVLRNAVSCAAGMTSGDAS